MMFSGDNNNKSQTDKINNSNMNQHKFSSKNKNKIYDSSKCDKRERNFMSRIKISQYINRTGDRFGIILYFCSSYNRFVNYINNNTIMSIGNNIINKEFKNNVKQYYMTKSVIIFIILFGLLYFYSDRYYIPSDNEIPFTYDIMGNIKAVRDSVTGLKLTAISVNQYLGEKDSHRIDITEIVKNSVLKRNLELFLFVMIDIFVASLFLISLATAVTSNLKKRQLIYMVARILLKVPKFNNFMLWMLGPLFGKLIVNLMVGVSELDTIHLILDEISNYFCNKKDDLSGSGNSPKSVYSHHTITTQLPSPNSDDEDFSDLPGLVFDDPSEESVLDCASDNFVENASEGISSESQQSGTTSTEMTERTSNVSRDINITDNQVKIK